MPIAALPPGTVCAIGSSQTITDSASLVKELIDNAIDARATVISVDISANTLDEIRVKDNGHGIAPEDRPMLCNRHCTSKIRDLNDLHEIGGRSLGFRGEALASAGELGGCLTVSTRIEGEVTATELTFNHPSRIPSEKCVSLPIGTTVRVEKFLDTLPVRKQTAVKNSVKILAKIRKTLKAYALARSHLRLSLKVLKAKTDKHNWKYPKTGTLGNSKVTVSPFNAATEVVGKKITDQCQWMTSTWSSAGDEIGAFAKDSANSGQETEPYIFEAVLARRDCDVSIITNVGQFISVDARPVSSRGTFKQIVSRYKSIIRSNCANEDGSKVVDPFLCMNIVCPPRSYDANVEPAKDDVLFTNPDLVLRLVETFFKNVYGETQIKAPGDKPVPMPKMQGVEVMLAREPTPVEKDAPIPRLPGGSKSPAVSRNLHPQHPNAILSCSLPNSIMIGPSTEIGEKPSLWESIIANNMPKSTFAVPNSELLLSEGSTRPTWKPSMYTEDDDSIEKLDQVLSQSVQPAMDDAIGEDVNLRSVHNSNPWVMAKLNAPFRPPRSSQSANEPIHQLPTPGRQRGDAGAHTELSSYDTILESRGKVIEWPTPVRFGRQTYEDPALTSPDPFPFPQKARGPRLDPGSQTRFKDANREHHGRGALDTWVQRSSYSSAKPFGKAALTEAEFEPESLQHRGDFVSARSLPQGTALNDIVDASQRPRRRPAPRIQQQGATRKPFVPLVSDPERVWFDTGDRPHKEKPQYARPRKEARQTGEPATLMLRDDETEDSQPPNQAFKRPIHPDLATTLDYEARKKQAEIQYRESLRQQAAPEKRDARAADSEARHAFNATKSPHKNRQDKAIAALHDEDESSLKVPSLGSNSAFGGDDPRAYLLREQQREAAQSKAGADALRPKRRKTAMLPFESMREDNHVRDLTLPINKFRVSMDEMIDKSAPHDQYVREGEDAEAFLSPTMRETSQWEAILKSLVKTAYRIEGMAPDGDTGRDLDVNLLVSLHEHEVRMAKLEVEEQASQAIVVK